MAEKMLIQNDLDYPIILRDNVLYYKFDSLYTLYWQRYNVQTELLLDADDVHLLQQSTYAMFERFTAFKERGVWYSHPMQSWK